MERKHHKHYKKNYKPLIVFLVILIAVLLIIVVKLASDYDSDIRVYDDGEQVLKTEEIVEPTPSPTPVKTEEPTPTPPPRRGTAEAIPDSVRASMQGKSMKSNASVTFDDLSYLTIPHYDFNYNVTTGHLVVAKSVAEEVLDIFAELYDAKYPIERMELIDKYNADDYTSIEYNNTSAFNYRVVSTGTGKLSNHAFGRAIDINPQQNPYVYSNGTGAHENAREFWKRDTSVWTRQVDRDACIAHNTDIYKIFKKYGWTWGGDWSPSKDYQHFEK